ncbi:MAG TPA: hypothetical protein VNJ31_08915 [Methyloceanibacter sp.]|nr:hypothetical protein [Methyloceanibacter sp.]
MSLAIDLDKAKLDPGSVFRAPEDVLAAKDLSADDKKAILLRWEADAEALLRATEEGMPPAEGRRSPAELLRAVHEAMQRLERKNHSPRCD